MPDTCNCQSETNPAKIEAFRNALLEADKVEHLTEIPTGAN